MPATLPPLNPQSAPASLAPQSRPLEREVMALDEVVAHAVVQHQRPRAEHWISADLSTVKVLAQPEALVTAVDSLLAWALRLGELVSLRLVKDADKPTGELWLKIEMLDAQAHDERHLNSRHWHLLWQLAGVEGVRVRCKVDERRIRVAVQFQRVSGAGSRFSPLS